MPVRVGGVRKAEPQITQSHPRQQKYQPGLNPPHATSADVAPRRPLRRPHLPRHRPRDARASRLGPGLLQSIYEECLRYALTNATIAFQHQVPLRVRYGDVVLQSMYIADVIVANQVVLELKAVEHMLPFHATQLLTYLRLTACQVGC